MPGKAIGIIGGMGPFAGLDIHKKVYQNTIAHSDQEHLDIVHFSFSQGIPDRTQFLLGETEENPAIAVADKLQSGQVDVIGIACNTFHAPEIFDVFQSALTLAGTRVLHLPNEVRQVVEEQFPEATVGVLSTLGTYQTKIYQNVFESSPVDVKFLSKEGCENIHRAIYHPAWGIKSRGNLSPEAKAIIDHAIDELQAVDAVLLACTELPLVEPELSHSVPIIDCNRVLARALVRYVAPDQLTPY